MAQLLGTFLCVFGLFDFGLWLFFDVDITGVWWSPLVAGAIGGYLLDIDDSAPDGLAGK